MMPKGVEDGLRISRPEMAVEELPLGPLEETLTARRASYLCSAFLKGEWTRRGPLAPHWVFAEREPDHRRESAKTASPINKRATIRGRLPAVRGGQQAATGRCAGSAER
jgi:hypothetical protein